MFVYVYAYYFLDGYFACVYPSVHSLSPSLLPSVPLIPECVTNGRSRCSALLCSSPGDSSSVCVCGTCVCVHARIPLMGGLGAVRRGLSRIPFSRREGREREQWVGDTRLTKLALGLPLGTGPPSTISRGTSEASLPLCVSLSPYFRSYFLSFHKSISW